MPEVTLTESEAGDILDLMKIKGTDLRAFGVRTEQERLAVGLVALRRYVKGETQHSISIDMGIPHATVGRYIKRALASIALPTVTEARIQMLEQIDRLLTVWMPIAESGDKDGAAAVLRFMERRAKLTGADAPIQVEAQVAEVTQQDLAIAEMIRDTEAKNKIAETHLKENA